MSDNKMYCKKRNAIALLITLFFVISITAAVSISLSQYQKGGEALNKSRFLVQSSTIMEDVLGMLQTMQEVKEIKDAQSLWVFLQGNTVLPIDAEGVQVLIDITSAHGKLNINELSSSETLQNLLSEYLLRYNVQDIAYLNALLLDCMRSQQPIYATQIIDTMPWMYHDRIANAEHLKQILAFYTQTRHDNSVQNVPWEKLFRFAENGSSEIDMNYATADLWQLMIPELKEEKAVLLTQNTEPYENEESIDLDLETQQTLAEFGVGYYTPVLNVDISIAKGDLEARIILEYAIDTKEVKVLTYAI